jgi:hypothetical protein
MSLVDAYEVLIVGGGRAGQALAADLGGVGHRVAMIERGMIGGTCINVDCIPTKTLVASAGVAELVLRAGQFGIRVDGWESDLAGVLANKRAVVSGIVGLSGIPGAPGPGDTAQPVDSHASGQIVLKRQRASQPADPEFESLTAATKEG